MTKEEYNEEYGKLMMKMLNEKNLEKRKEINEELIKLKSVYKKSIIEERIKNKDRRVLKW